MRNLPLMQYLVKQVNSAFQAPIGKNIQDIMHDSRDVYRELYESFRDDNITESYHATLSPSLFLCCWKLGTLYSEMYNFAEE